jgi:AcrR family transcriptional regulator
MAAEQRREHLLDAALSVIIEQGYAKVSIEAIARAAGVTRPVVYDHFSDLGELLRELIDREERLAMEQLVDLLPSDPEHDDPPEILAAAVRHFLDAVTGRPDTWKLILWPLEGTPDLVRQHVRSNRASLLARIEDVVRWSIERSEASEPVDVELAARAILGLAEDAGRMVLRDPEHYSRQRYEAFVHWMMKLLWRG